jgi:ATP phosphoribosyltransferase regulatory subunit
MRSVHVLQIDPAGFEPSEKIMYTLRRLYEQYGYRAFSMNKLEEYAFYAPYMRFLERPEIIVFSDLDGRLMAMKPDVTLSIVKNVSPDIRGIRKLYYAENVYRPSPTAREFREIRQIGLECIGAVDLYTIAEVLSLSAKSLGAVDPEYSLDVSHLGVVSALLDRHLSDYAARDAVLSCIKQKNPHDLMRAALAAGMDPGWAERLCALVTLRGNFPEALREAEKLADAESLPAIAMLGELYDLLGCDRLRLDFSIVSDTDYYNGVTFHGYVRNAPDAVLKGGQYDNLLVRMGKEGCGAIGFAVYFDALESYYRTQRQPEADVFVLYDGATPPETVRRAVEDQVAAGRTVCANTARPEDVRFGRTIDIRGEK